MYIMYVNVDRKKMMKKNLSEEERWNMRDDIRVAG